MTKNSVTIITVVVTGNLHWCSWSNVRCDYLNASISPMVLPESQPKHWKENQSCIENQALALMYIQSFSLWEQPTFYAFIQPSNRDGFGYLTAHAPIDTVLFYTLKRYVCILKDIGLGSWSLCKHIIVIDIAYSRRINRNRVLWAQKAYAFQ